MGLFDRGWVKISFEDANAFKKVLLELFPTPQAPFFGVDRHSLSLEHELALDFARGINEQIPDITRLWAGSGRTAQGPSTSHRVLFEAPRYHARATERGIDLHLQIQYVRNDYDPGVLDYRGIISSTQLVDLVKH